MSVQPCGICERVHETAVAGMDVISLPTNYVDYEEAYIIAFEVLRKIAQLTDHAAPRVLDDLAQARQALARLYDAVDEAQRIDNTGGDSAVSVVLWSWAERRAAVAGEDTT